MSIRDILDDKYKIKSQFIPDNLMNKEDFQKEIKIYTEEIAELKEKIQELKKYKETIESQYPAMFELLRQRMEKLEKK